ncbi:hypothetical protein Lser_V15G44024 [Lactuca serriola]
MFFGSKPEGSVIFIGAPPSSCHLLSGATPSLQTWKDDEDLVELVTSFTVLDQHIVVNKHR